VDTLKTTIEVGDPTGSRYQPVEATIDTGATYAIIPAHILKELSVDVLERRSFELADGRTADYDLGETKIRLEGRSMTRAVVFGNGQAMPVIGADTLEGLGLVVDPIRKKLLPARGLML
jgi:clan AA aspartic protease